MPIWSGTLDTATKAVFVFNSDIFVGLCPDHLCCPHLPVVTPTRRIARAINVNVNVSPVPSLCNEWPATMCVQATLTTFWNSLSQTDEDQFIWFFNKISSFVFQWFGGCTEYEYHFVQWSDYRVDMDASCMPCIPGRGSLVFWSAWWWLALTVVAAREGCDHQQQHSYLSEVDQNTEHRPQHWDRDDTLPGPGWQR